MKLTEFIESYSDDLISLQEGRNALLTHPLRSYHIVTDLVDASFCRMLSIIMVGSIETMLKAWRERDRVSVLGKYFENNVQNGERIRGLCDAFQAAGIPVDPDVFNDYLAIKYLRNTIVHGSWKAHEQAWVAERGFPTDSRLLKGQHFARMQQINDNMMLYIARTAHAKSDAKAPTGSIKLKERNREPDEHLGILTERDIDEIFWNNLERIHSVIGAAIQEAAADPRYDWTAGQTMEDLDASPPFALKRRMYLAARRAGVENFEKLARHRDLAGPAIDSWREYYRRVTQRSGLNDKAIADSLATLESSTFDPTAKHWAILHNLPEGPQTALLQNVCPDYDPAEAQKALRALRAGKLAYELFRNIMPVALLGAYLPIVDPAKTADYAQEFDRAFNAVCLGQVWYYCVDRHEVFRSENLNLFRRLRGDFALH